VPRGPALDYGDPDLRRRVLGELEKLARKQSAIFIKIDPALVQYWGAGKERSSPTAARFVEDLRRRGWRFASEQIQFRNTVELDLTRSEDDLLGAMKQKTRYNIRLAGRKDIAVREGGMADLPALAAMYRQTAARDGFAIRPTEYYLDAWRTFLEAGMGLPLLAEFQGEAVAALFLVLFGDRATYMYGASSDRERQRMPNHLLQWEAIRAAKARGYAVYDFWGAPDEFVETDALWGVWRFKEGFQGDVVHHIGAWDFPARPFWYWIYTRVMPTYLTYLRSRRNSIEGGPAPSQNTME
jgi:lipid II:glycine glycyltransferase (peptidoglycan interpeptide bridge formation enzyme)